MKRKLSLVVLLGLVMGAMFAGCQKQENPPSDTSTNAPTSTNK